MSGSLENPPLIRPFKVEEDMPRFIRLRTEIEAIDQAGADTSETALQAELAWRGHDPEKDRWVVETADQPDIFLGYAAAFNPIPERYTVSIEVHPAWRRQKLGSALLAQVIPRARELGAEHLLIYAEAANEAANAFLRQNGLSAVSDAWFMSAPATLSLSEPDWPEGYTVRSFAQVQDLSTLKEAYFRSYRDMWGHGANRKTVDEITPESMAPLWLPDWDSTGEGLFLVFGPDGIAGLCRAIIGPKKDEPGDDKPVGLVDSPGVVPEHRRYELQRPLTLMAMQWLRAQGHGAFELWSYGDDVRTVDIYRELGFTVFSHLIAYHLDLN